MKKVIISIILVILSPVVQAEELDSGYFKDWFALTNLLRTKGIDPSSPSWATIVPVCLPLKSSDDERYYNKCLYEKVMDEYQWHIDNKFCIDKADKEYRYDLQNTENTISVINNNRNRSAIDSYRQGINRYPVKDRDMRYRNCMIMYLNWSDPNRWIAGKRNQ